MTLEFVGGKTIVGTTGLSGDLTGLTGGISTEPIDGDFIIVSAGCASNNSQTVSISTAGYDERLKIVSNGAARHSSLTIGTKFFNAGDPSSIAATGSPSSTYASVMSIHVWRGVDKTTPLDVAVNSATGINSKVMNAPAITPVTAGAVIIIAGSGAGNAVFNGATLPSGFSNRVFMSSDPGIALGVGLGSAAWNGTGAVDPGAWGSVNSNNGDTWAAASLALRPAADLPPVGSLIRHHAGGVWQPAAPLMRHDGTAWVPATLLQWDGADWAAI